MFVLTIMNKRMLCRSGDDVHAEREQRCVGRGFHDRGHGAWGANQVSSAGRTFKLGKN